MAFSKKHIDLVFTLGGSNTFNGTANQVTVKGLRVSCKIVKTASAAMNECQLRIWGLSPDIYNKLTSIYSVTNYIQQNTVRVMAGDSETNPNPTVFIGQITIAQIDLNSQPDSVMNIVAQTALLQALVPVDSTKYPNSFDVATAMGSLATIMNLDFEPNGVQQILPRSTFNGTARDQAIDLARAANINMIIDDNTLVIFPKNGSRTSQKVITISDAQEPAMIGYPSYSNIGIGVKTLYNPGIKWGAQIQVTSSLKVANLNGIWTVFGLAHTLESEMPDGRWDTEIQANNPSAIGP
jgi:hypothetical protein